jgi:nickel-dependent lactate racemase
MKVELPYLQRYLTVEFPEEQLLADAEPREYRSEADEKTLLEKALEKPFGAEGKAGEPLEEFLRGLRSLLIIINDATRPTPTAAMLRALLPYLERAGVSDERVTLLVAAGAHRAPLEDEYEQILGPLYRRFRARAVYHDAKDEASLTDLGATRNGTPIVLNKRLFEADGIIVTGSVEPHYFAGFTGGRKAFLPGVAAFRTIEANHKLALSPRARSLSLEGNPVHEDMMDALPLIKARVFSFMTVLDKEQKAVYASAGDIMSSFYAAVDAARQIFCVAVPEPADVVISVAKFPMDIDLYQSQKAIDNGACALKDGGTLILVSSCRRGIGDEAYAQLLSSCESPAAALRKIETGFKLGYHKAAKMAAVSQRAHITALTELPKELLAGMFIESASSAQEALDAALERSRKNGAAAPRILILPDGCVTVPELPGALKQR